MCAQNKCQRRKYLTYWGGDRKKMKRAEFKFSNNSLNFLKRVVTLTFYVMKYKWKAYLARD